jgi:hypothetical protein
MRHLRKLIPSSFRWNPVPPVHNNEPGDPLDVRLFVLSITQSSAAGSTTGKVRRHLSTLWPNNIGRPLVPIAEVPLAQGESVRSVDHFALSSRPQA